MEIFGLLVPMWALFLSIYVIGMPLIGYPVGKFSLKSWKYPKKYPRLGKILFPLGDGDEFGYDPRRPLRSEPTPTMAAFGVNNALVYNDPLPLAQYLVIQTFIWPLRLVYTIVMLSIVIAFGFPTFAGKQLMRCKRCVDI